MDFSFESFYNGNFDYDSETETHTCLWLREEKMDIGGGKISIENIDKLKDCPNIDVVTISGLRQDTFEYFIKTYGRQLKAIRFFKNKFIQDWSLLGTLPQLEYLDFFVNCHISSLWDMSQNTSLSGLCIHDFTQLSSIEGIETAPALKEFVIGNAMWDKMILESLMPLANTHIEKFMFCGKCIKENDYSFLANMPYLKQFDFPTNMLTTEQVAWIVANFPTLEGFALRAKRDCTLFDSELKNVPGVLIVGRRKPSLIIEGNEKRIEKYVQNFEMLKEKYAGIPYKMAFVD